MSAKADPIPQMAADTDPIPQIKPLIPKRTDFWDLLQAVRDDDLLDGELTIEEQEFANTLNSELGAEFLGVENGPVGIQVQQGPGLTSEELGHATTRAGLAAELLPAFLGKERVEDGIPKGRAPRIAVAASGGGYRAMLGTAAFVDFARSHHLYDQITYFAGLSGSTWALSTALDNLFRRSDIQPWTKEFWTAAVSRNLLTSIGETGFTEALLKALKTAKSKGRSFTLVDLYGLLFHFKIGGRQTDPDHWTTLNELATILDPAQHPYPIFTCITEETVEWMEMTPHSVGLVQKQFFIPTSTFGMKFVDGVWGSAFAFDYQAARAFLNVENPLAKALLWAAIKCTRSARVPRVLNFLQGTSHTTSASEHLPIKDAGAGPVPTSFNLPLPPLIERPEREIDIIIVLEMSAGCSSVDGDGEIRKASQYFDGKRFPKTLPNPLTDQIAPSFGSIRLLKPLGGGPWTIYIPIKSSPELDVDDALKTQYFQYDTAVVHAYWDLIHQILDDSLESIKDIIKAKWMTIV